MNHPESLRSVRPDSSRSLNSRSSVVRTKSYLTSHEVTRKDARSKHDPTDSHGVKNSLAKFLAASEDEDLLFIDDIKTVDERDRNFAAAKNGSSSGRNKDNIGNDNDNDNDAKSITSDILFDPVALKKAGTKTSRRTRTSDFNRSASGAAFLTGDGTSGTNGTERRRKKPDQRRMTSRNSHGTRSRSGGRDRRVARSSRGQRNRDSSNKSSDKSSDELGENDNNNNSNSNINVEDLFDNSTDSLPFEEFHDSFASTNTGSSMGRNRRLSNRRQGSNASLPQPQPQRTSRRETLRKSVQEQRAITPTKRTPRSSRRKSLGELAQSQSHPHSHPHSHSHSQSQSNSGVRRSLSAIAPPSATTGGRPQPPQRKSLSMGLEDLDKASRQKRIKDMYRLSANSGERDGDNDSVASGRSMKSTNTAITARSSYKSSGLEGGALGAFMNHELQRGNNGGGAGGGGRLSGASIGNNVGAGASVASAPAGEAYMKERRAQQDRILDAAVREKWKHDAERERLEKEKLSDEEKKRKKKGLASRVASVAKKTAELSRSSSLGALNLLAGAVAGDEHQAVRRGRKSTSAAVAAATAAGGGGGGGGAGASFGADGGARKGGRRNGRKTADVTTAATHSSNSGDDYSDSEEDLRDGEIDYNPRALTDRQTESLVERLTHQDDNDNDDDDDTDVMKTANEDVKKKPIRRRTSSNDLFAELQLDLSDINKKTSKGNDGWWDI